ncbi:MAG: cell division protein ZapB [Desulfobulbus sp.]
MEYSAELARLEEFVDKLLNKYSKLKSECHALQETLRQREGECVDLKNKVFELGAERTEVGNKVSGLLDRIEQWENDQLSAGAPRDEGNSDTKGSLYRDDTEMKTY